ncbi:Sigma factor regulator C-terminal [Lentibacillus halodurans]|uniref:Sigma factor regulator C-terminal n=1 Tax=Lentibacillus halodurans TaxID=237679 RepID=A0A1I0WH74_9BACI|nr:anti sigma factor C-terminal domain-containing protein [Lentibacillus halodurans]SFA88001.1 Sigma factor regulator C-terminal [Lentibacillus halodurans]
MKKDHDSVLEDLKEDDQMKHDKKSARKMIWHTRLSIGFTVIRTLLLIFLLYILYMIPVEMYYDMTGKQAGFDRLVTTLVETRYPGVEVDNMHGRHAEINPILTQSTTLKLYRSVGEWKVAAGEVEAKKRLFGDVNLKLHFDEKYLGENMVPDFALPPEILDQESSDKVSGSTEQLKEQLAKIGDGHVVQAQFSVKEAMKPNQLLKKLSEYDVRVYQMPVYGGEMTDIRDISYSRSGQFTFVQPLLLKPQIIYDENNRHSSSVSYLSDVTIEESIDQFYQNVDWLIENGNYSGREIDQQRINYIRKHGMLVYGAVVSGPIREIEKLIDEELFHQFNLGGIEVWNWDNG